MPMPMAVPLPPENPYGAAELKRVAQRYMTWALALAGGAHLLLVGTWWILSHRAEAPPAHTVRIMKYSELGPPPSISTASAPPVVAVNLPKTAAKPKIAVPVPVPDEQAEPDQTIPAQDEIVAPVSEAAGDGTGTAVEQDVALGPIEDDGPPPEFVPFEKEPAVVKRTEPAYPEAAKQSGIEGSVFAKLWIDKEGKVKDVVILKTPSEIFNAAVVEAAKQWVFTPAVMNSGPVAVWYPVKFTFHLQ